MCACCIQMSQHESTTSSEGSHLYSDRGHWLFGADLSTNIISYWPFFLVALLMCFGCAQTAALHIRTWCDKRRMRQLQHRNGCRRLQLARNKKKHGEEQLPQTPEIDSAADAKRVGRSPVSRAALAAAVDGVEGFPAAAATPTALTPNATPTLGSTSTMERAMQVKSHPRSHYTRHQQRDRNPNSSMNIPHPKADSADDNVVTQSSMSSASQAHGKGSVVVSSSSFTSDDMPLTASFGDDSQASPSASSRCPQYTEDERRSIDKKRRENAHAWLEAKKAMESTACGDSSGVPSVMVNRRTVAKEKKLETLSSL